MPLEIHIDNPEDLEIRHPLSIIKGWCAVDSMQEAGTLDFDIAGQRVPYRRMSRPDVEEARPGKTVRGFLIDLDLRSYLVGVRTSECVMRAGTANSFAEVRFHVSRRVFAKCLDAAG